jgi:hypothetical protein
MPCTYVCCVYCLRYGAVGLLHATAGRQLENSQDAASSMHHRLKRIELSRNTGHYSA